MGSHVYQSIRQTIKTGIWNKEIAAAKINFELVTLVDPIVIDGYEETRKTLTDLPGATAIPAVEWLKDTPNNLSL